MLLYSLNENGSLDTTSRALGNLNNYLRILNRIPATSRATGNLNNYLRILNRIPAFCLLDAVN